MHDPLKQLEAQLQQMVPRGLGDCGRERLEARIECLAEEADARMPPHRSRIRVLGVAAGLGVMGALAVLPGLNRAGPEPLAGNSVPTSPEVVPASFETVELVQNVGGRFDGGYVLGNGTQSPRRYWGYSVTEMEEILDHETGFTVRISSQREEGVLTKLTTF